MLGNFNDWSIVGFSNKATPQEDIDKICHMVLDGISDNITGLAKTYKCGAIKTTYDSTIGYYVVKFMSEAYMLQEKYEHNVQISEVGELVAKPQHTDCMKVNKNWHWVRATKHNTIIIPTCTIVQPSLDVVIIIYFK